MDPERYQQVKRIYIEASRLEGDTRQSYIEAECGGDAELLREVLALLGPGHISTDDLASPIRTAAGR